MGRDPDPAQIEPIRVPASLNRHVGVISLVRVPLTSSNEYSELVVVQIEYVATKLSSEGSSPRAMFRIGDFVDPSRIVENGE